MDDYSVYAQYYDLDHGSLDADLVMIEQYAALCGSPILELACGTGRALLPLARQGYQVTGVDISPNMLAIARRKIETDGLADKVTLVKQDMRRLALDGRFNLAFVAAELFHAPASL